MSITDQPITIPYHYALRKGAVGTYQEPTIKAISGPSYIGTATAGLDRMSALRERDAKVIELESKHHDAELRCIDLARRLTEAENRNKDCKEVEILLQMEAADNDRLRSENAKLTTQRDTLKETLLKIAALLPE